MSDNTVFVIVKFVDGGYGVGREYDDVLLAATTLDEALCYIRKKLQPDEPRVPDDEVARRQAQYTSNYRHPSAAIDVPIGFFSP